MKANSAESEGTSQSTVAWGRVQDEEIETGREDRLLEIIHEKKRGENCKKRWLLWGRDLFYFTVYMQLLPQFYWKIVDMLEHLSIDYKEVSSKEGDTEGRDCKGDNWWREVLGKTTWDEVRTQVGGSDCKFDNVDIDYFKNIDNRRLTSWYFLKFPTG